MRKGQIQILIKFRDIFRQPEVFGRRTRINMEQLLPIKKNLPLKRVSLPLAAGYLHNQQLINFEKGNKSIQI